MTIVLDLPHAGLVAVPDVPPAPPAYVYAYVHGRMRHEPEGSDSHRIVRYLPSDGVLPHREVECVAACLTFEAAVAAGALMTGHVLGEPAMLPEIVAR